MRIDSSLAFVPYGAPLSCVGVTGASFTSSVIDLLGSGVGTPPANIIGNATVFGEDIGVGGTGPQPTLIVSVGTAFVTANSGTLNVQLQAAVDTAVTFQPGTWITLVETGAIAASNLTAGEILARYDMPPAFPPGTLPRYLRLNFSTATGTSFSAGTIAFAYPTYVRDDQANKYAASNYKVS
jgi:hypothetical protein